MKNLAVVLSIAKVVINLALVSFHENFSTKSMMRCNGVVILSRMKMEM